jgi:PAS domain S-box-containing protein
VNPGRAEREGSSIDVLLVEDNAADALLIQEMLESSGLKLNPVPRLSSALDALEDRAFEAVLLDLGLPDSQGLETLARLRTASRDAPIIVASGLDDEALALRAVELGAQDYIIKGRFDGERLERALRYAVARARVERLVRENAQQYGGLFDANPHPMWVIDADHLTFLAVNEAAIRAYGWSRMEFLSMSAGDLVPEPERQRFMQGLAAARSEGKPQVLGVAGTCRHLARGDAVLEVELTVSAIPFRGRPAYLGISTDVTENRRLQAELVQANKMRALGQLAGGVAHDFNNALGIITGYAELVARDPRADPAIRERVERILQAARQSAGLTRQLLAFSRRQVLEPRVIDLNALVEELGGMLPGLIGGRADVTISTRDGLSPVRADRVQLQQVMLNLVINARDAMPRGGTVAIETFDAGVRSQRGGEPRAFVGLRVRDDGEGMDAQTAARVFEPFFTTKGEGQGTGLGLATVYGIVRQSGGSIEVESEPGRGTTFRVYLPAVEGAVDDDVSDERETAPVPGGRETVLLVEDSESLRDMVAEMLESAGYEVLEVPGPEAAIERSRAFEGGIDLLLTDMMMPVMNGRELAARLAELRPGIPVLFMSGYSSELLDVQGQPIPGVNLLQKPFTGRELLQRVREALGRSKS